jgi:hypothetical protein
MGVEAIDWSRMPLTPHVLPDVSGSSWASPISPDVNHALSRVQMPLQPIWDSSAFGSEHPQINELKRKYEWSFEELNWLRGWFTVPGNLLMDSRYRKCLDEIRHSASEVKNIFHPHHVRDSARLRSGALRVEKEWS